MRGSLLAIAILFASATVVAGCGGGGGGSSPGVTPTSNPTATQPPVTTASLTVGTANSAYAQFQPITEGAYASVSVPAASSGSASIMGTLSASVPSSAPTLSSAARLPRAVGGSPYGLLYVTLEATATVTFPTSPSFTFTLPANITVLAGDSTYVALYDPTNPSLGWQLLTAPGNQSGQTFTFTPASSSFTFAANQVYAFAFFSTAQPIIVATPSPSPSPTLSPTPTPSPQASPFVASSSTTITTSTLPIALPSAGPWSGTLTLSFSQFDPGTPLNYTLTNYLPTGVSPISAVRHVLDLSPPVLYVSLTTGSSLSNLATLNAAPAFAFTVANQGFIVSGDEYWLGLFDSSLATTGWQDFGGPASFAGTAISIDGSSPMLFEAGVTYTFALYPSGAAGTLPATPAPGSTTGPSPSPQPSPTASAGASPTASPTSSGGGIGITIGVPTPPPVVVAPVGPLQFSGDGQTQYASLSELGYGGGFTAISLDPAVATANAAINPSGNYTLTVTSVSAGSTEIQVSSRNGGYGSVGVIVTSP